MAYSGYEIWYRSTRNYYQVIYLMAERMRESEMEGTKTPPCLLPIHTKLYSLSSSPWVENILDEIWMVSVSIVSNVPFCYGELYDAYRRPASMVAGWGGVGFLL